MNYLRLCWYYLFKYDVERDGRQFKLTGWQHLQATDGPIHTVWVWWGCLTSNWFTIGWHCWRHGHDWREQFVTWAPERRYGVNTKLTSTGRTLRWYVVACAYCGQYRGAGSTAVKSD